MRFGQTASVVKPRCKFNCILGKLDRAARFAAMKPEALVQQLFEPPAILAIAVRCLLFQSVAALLLTSGSQGRGRLAPTHCPLREFSKKK